MIAKRRVQVQSFSSLDVEADETWSSILRGAPSGHAAAEAAAVDACTLKTLKQWLRVHLGGEKGRARRLTLLVELSLIHI